MGHRLASEPTPSELPGFEHATLLHSDFVSGVHTFLNNSFPSYDSVTSDRPWIALLHSFVQAIFMVPLDACRFEQNDLAVDNRYTRANNLANLGVSPLLTVTVSLWALTRTVQPN